MAYQQQTLHNIFIEKLKNIKECNINFQGENRLTAILGINGSGKSTILHALSCVYKPIDETNVEIPNYKFSHFFTPTSHTNWRGSKFSIRHSYRDDRNPTTTPEIETVYAKAEDRWTPKYSKRISRHISFIGIKTTVPAIELENQVSLIRLNTQQLNDSQSQKVREIAGFIMNRNYTRYDLYSSSKKKYIGVTCGLDEYCSLSMGAGEQRIFYILSEIIKTPKYGLVLIDEIDLLLHQDALERLLGEINKIANANKLQVIFTTHNHQIVNLPFINFRHLYQTPEKTFCFEDTKPEAIRRLTGKQDRPIEIFVEDDLAKSIIHKCADQLGIRKFVAVREYGPVRNCFTAASGSLLNGINMEHMLYVLDGDEYRTELEKKNQIKQILTGDQPEHDTKREIVLTKISQFNLPMDIGPECFLHDIIVNLERSSLSDEQKQIFDIANNVVNTDNDHKFIDDIICEMGDDRGVGLEKIISIIKDTSQWNDFIKPIKDWLVEKKTSLVES